MTKYTLSEPRPRTELLAEFQREHAMWHGHTCDEPDAPYWHLLSQADRDKAEASGAAMEGGGYPILGCTGDNSVDTAIHAVGRGNANHDAIRKHIITRAKSLGCSSKIPDNWNADGSLQASAFATPDAPVPTEPSPADAEVSDGAKALVEAVSKLQAEQKLDPDDATDPNDEDVTKLLDQIDTLATQLVQAQTKDEGADVPNVGDAPAPTMNPTDKTPAKLAATPGEAEGVNPVDSLGNVDPDVLCATPGCGHVASLHGNTTTGDNTGACSTPGCDCEMMTLATNAGDSGVQGEGDADAEPGGVDEPPGPVAKMAAAPGQASPPPDMPMPEEPTNAVEPGDDLNAPPNVTGGMNMGPAFCIPVALVEGQPTDDGREINPDAIYWDQPPYALMGMATSTHDPMGMDLNDPAIIIGRIDSWERADGESGTQVIMGKGYFLSNDDGLYFADLLDQMGRLPGSADVQMDEEEVVGVEVDEMGFPTAMTKTLTKGKLVAWTVLPFGPAFPSAYIVLGDGIPASPIPVTTTENLMTASQRVHFIVESACVPCDEGLDVLVASGGGPLKPPKSWFDDPGFIEGDGRLLPFEARGPHGSLITGYACPPTVTEEGEYFGHIAPWGTCLMSDDRRCITAPRSTADYAHYKRGQHVITAEGEPIRVGVVTAATGHAGYGHDARGAMAHYDNTALQAADVNTGEDAFGIWFHGAVRPNVTEHQIRMLRASALSGDWRDIGGHLELVAALAVNEPGFAPGFTADITQTHALAASGRIISLVAAGASAMLKLQRQDIHELTEEETDELLKLSLKPMLRIIKRDATERLTLQAEEIVFANRERIAALEEV